MARIKFNHIFVPLVMLSGLSAFVSSPDSGQAVRGRVETLFTPVSYPMRQLAGEVSRKLDRSQGREFGEVAISGDVLDENQRLRNQVASLTMQMEAIKSIGAARELRGDARKYAVPVKVSGSDASGRQILHLKGGTSNNLSAGQPVVRNDAMIGRVLSASSSSATVKLITDATSHIAGQFGRISDAPDGRIEFTPLQGLTPLVDGRGNGKMAVTNLPLGDVNKAGLAKGDYVVLRDPDDWPLIVNGFILGRVESIKPQAKAPLYAEIEIVPKTKLMQLTEVMVVQLPEEAAGAKPARTK